MKNIRDFLDLFVTERHELILEEKDVTKTLGIINKHHRIPPDMRVGSCSDADERNRWFIHFTTTKAKWKAVRSDLKVKRVFEISDIPTDMKGVIYSMD